MIEFIDAVVKLFIILIRDSPETLSYLATALAILITLPSFVPSFIAVPWPFRFLIELVRSFNFFVMVVVALFFAMDGVDLFRSFFIGANWSSILSLQLVDF